MLLNEKHTLLLVKITSQSAEQQILGKNLFFCQSQQKGRTLTSYDYVYT